MGGRGRRTLRLLADEPTEIFRPPSACRQPRRSPNVSRRSTRAILAALLANAGIAVAKFVGFLVTGSSSMLAEAVHSVADTSNQGCCCSVSGKRASRPMICTSSDLGVSRYFYSFVVALVLFSLGAVFALYEGYHKIVHPVPLSSPVVAIAILVVAIGLRVQFSDGCCRVEAAQGGEYLVAVHSSVA